MARANPTRADPAPGAGTMFTLRAIGLVLLARWLYSMAQMGYGESLSAMASSPWASINGVFLFLLIVLPGARARAERPFHPLPQWLRQALRLFAFLCLVFALWLIGVFVWAQGGRSAVNAVTETNGWLVAAPALYAAVLWICRPRALWRTNAAARRFAIGRYAILLDAASRTAVVWAESRKLGQYDARELSVKWPVASALERERTTVAGAATAQAIADGAPSSGANGGVAPVRARGWARRSQVALLWDSPAAVGHNRQTIFRTTIATDGDRTSAHALDATLRQV